MLRQILLFLLIDIYRFRQYASLAGWDLLTYLLSWLAGRNLEYENEKKSHVNIQHFCSHLRRFAAVLEALQQFFIDFSLIVHPHVQAIAGPPPCASPSIGRRDGHMPMPKRLHMLQRLVDNSRQSSLCHLSTSDQDKDGIKHVGEVIHHVWCHSSFNMDLW